MSLISPQLQAFFVIAEVRSVHQAAKSLKISQTGVTQRLKVLESQLGVSLFERSRKGMRLTREGESPYRYCQNVRALEGETLALFGGKDSNQNAFIQKVALCGPSSLMRARIIPQTIGLCESYPNLRLTFDIDDNVGSVMSKLRSGQTQFAILPREKVQLEMDSKLLKPENYQLIVPYAWRNRELKALIEEESIIDYNEDDRMTFNFLELQGVQEHVHRERHFANNTDSLLFMIENALGFSVVAEEFAKSAVAEKRVAAVNGAKKYLTHSALAWYPRPELPPYLKALIQQIV